MSNKIEHLHLSDALKFRKCPREFYFSKVKRIKRADYPVHIHFLEGTLLHELLREHYTGIEMRLPYGDCFMGNFWGGFGMAHVYRTFEHYKTFYKDEPHWEVLSSEQSLFLNLGGFEWAATFDMKTINLETDVVTIWDHKYYKSDLDEDWVFWEEQPNYYLWTAKQFGWKADFRLNYIRKIPFKFPTLTTTGKLSYAENVCANFTSEEYEEVMNVFQLENSPKHVERLQELQLRDRTAFKRIDCQPNEARLIEVEKRILTSIDELSKRNLDSIGDFPKNVCSNCEYCDYKQICKTEMIEPEKVESVIDNYFISKRQDER
jgi:hypothetical protein